MDKYIAGMELTCRKCGKRAVAVSAKRMKQHWTGKYNKNGASKIMCFG